MEMKIRYILAPILIALLAAAVVLPWIEAYRSDQMTHFLYGRVNGKQIECIAVDGTHFDRFACLVFAAENKSRVRHSKGKILLDGKAIDFPKGCNVGWLRSDNQIEFETVTQDDVTNDTSGSSEIYYIFGRLPKLKKWRFG